MTAAQTADIIRFWHAVEMFSPQPVEKVDRERRVFSVQRGLPLPWDPTHELAEIKLHENQTWHHVVYLGVYRLEAVYEILQRVFEPDPESYEERPGGESAHAAFLVSADGRPLLDSQVLSSCAWATGRSIRPGPDKPGWLTGLRGAVTEFDHAFAEVTAADAGDTDAETLAAEGHPVAGSWTSISYRRVSARPWR